MDGWKGAWLDRNIFMGGVYNIFIYYLKKKNSLLFFHTIYFNIQLYYLATHTNTHTFYEFKMEYFTNNTRGWKLL